MNVEAKCKFCGKSLVLEIDDDYAALGDPFKLMQLASCNRCGDFREKRRKLMEQIKFNCMMLLGGGIKKEALPKTREILVGQIQRYMRLLAEFKDQNVPDWDSALIDDIMEKPGNYALILGQVPKMFQQPSLV